MPAVFADSVLPTLHRVVCPGRPSPQSHQGPQLGLWGRGLSRLRSCTFNRPPPVPPWMCPSQPHALRSVPVSPAPPPLTALREGGQHPASCQSRNPELSVPKVRLPVSNSGVSSPSLQSPSVPPVHLPPVTPGRWHKLPGLSLVGSASHRSALHPQ